MSRRKEKKREAKESTIESVSKDDDLRLAFESTLSRDDLVDFGLAWGVPRHVAVFTIPGARTRSVRVVRVEEWEPNHRRMPAWESITDWDVGRGRHQGKGEGRKRLT